VGSLTDIGQATAIAVSGTTAFVGGGTPSFRSIDISNPTTPVLLDSLELGTTAYVTVDVSGNLAVIGRPGFGIGAQNKSIAIVDISDPSNLSLLSNTAIATVDLVTTNQFAFAAQAGLLIIDFSVPSTPQVISSISTSAQGGREVALSDDLALLAVTDGVALIDISDETRPEVNFIIPFDPEYTISTGLQSQGDFVYKTATATFGGPGKLFIGRYRAPEDNAGILPTVSIISPSSGSSAEEGSVLSVVIDATDDIGVASVDLLVDGQVVATDIAAPFQLDINVPTGVSDITLSARATDFGGNVGVSSDISLTVTPSDLIAPDVTITSPSDGTISSTGSLLDVFVDATDDVAIDSVDLLMNGTVVSTDNSAPYEFSITLPNQPGNAILTARATDTSNNSALSNGVRVSVCGNTSITGRTVDRTGAAAENIQIFVDGERLTATNASGDFNISNLSVCRSTVEVIASGELAGQIVSGRSTQLTVVLNGTTNSGDIVVSPLGFALYAGPEFPVGNAPNSAIVADFDGDSVKDVVTANFGSESISLLIGNGQGLFLQEQRFKAEISLLQSHQLILTVMVKQTL
jgi:large repetitive protein